VGIRGDPLHVGPGDEPAEQPLPAQGHEWRRERGPLGAELCGDRAEEDGVVRPPGGGERNDGNGVCDGQAALASPTGLLDVLEDRTMGEPGERDVDAGLAKKLQLVRLRGFSIDSDQDPHMQAETSEHQ
jgi:hypothetical protein